jgi:hypothetical protein
VHDGDERDEHEQCHERPDVGREEVVHRDADGIGGDDRGEGDLVPVGRLEDPVVRDAGEDRLRGLEG